MRCLKVGSGKLLLHISSDFESHLRELTQAGVKPEPIRFEVGGDPVNFVSVGGGWFVAFRQKAKHGVSTLDYKKQVWFEDLIHVQAFIRRVWKGWLRAQQKQEGGNFPNNTSQKRKTLKLPKKQADPERVQDVINKINDKYGHIPNRRKEASRPTIH